MEEERFNYQIVFVHIEVLPLRQLFINAGGTVDFVL